MAEHDCNYPAYDFEEDDEKHFWDEALFNLLKHGGGLSVALKGADEALEHRRKKFARKTT